MNQWRSRGLIQGKSSCLVFLYNPLCCKALCANTRCRWTLDSGTTIHHGASNRRSGVAATGFEVICLSPCTRQVDAVLGHIQSY
ncbi:unnamed protein product [Leptidea sinapis]|uniref:Uncharacterized protein n=1 Tax=Leptidea sinapis TaxID=189913 RepID=A0A5E4QYE7_9NEOP|nr:unnamed protein product [Leptidea sinapis]